MHQTLIAQAEIWTMLTMITRDATVRARILTVSDIKYEDESIINRDVC